MLKLLLSLIGWGYIRFLAATSRITQHGLEIPAKLKQEKKPFIFAFWHGRQLFLPFVRRKDALDALISQSKDGEYIAGIISFFGIGSIRGSSSHGGRRALVQIMRSLKCGRLVAITPDGPRGPQKSVRPGVIFVAKKMQVPIVPIAFAARRKKVILGWDEYLVPYPFNKIAVTYGEPYYVMPDISVESASTELQTRINKITDLADTLLN